MDNSELFKVIFKRKSIRKYDMTSLPQEKLEQLQNFCKNVKRLEQGIKTEFSIESDSDAKGLFAIKAPHYISIYSELKEESMLNVGFIMQQIDLYCSASGLGSCWLGVAKPKNIPKKKDGLEHIITLSFGTPSEPLYRTGPEQFKRSSLSEITSIPDSEALLEPVRLAPSAVNSQPWFFSGNFKEIIVSRKKLNIIKAQIYGRFNKIDTGISLCHLWLSAENLGYKIEFNFSDRAVPEGCEFMATAKLIDKNS